MQTDFKDGSIVYFVESNSYENFEFIVKIRSGGDKSGVYLIVDGAVHVSSKELEYDTMEKDASSDIPIDDLDFEDNSQVMENDALGDTGYSKWMSFSSYLKSINFDPQVSGEPFINVIEHPLIRHISTNEFDTYMEFKDLT